MAKQYSLKRLFNYIKFKDILNLFAAAFVFPWAIIAKIFVRNFWLVCEDRNEARDNGYWFFKWVRKNKPKQKIAYAINKKSPDYQKVKGLGKVISYGTLSHWFWYIVADKNVSSQKGGKPNAAVCYLMEVVFGLRKNNRIFLQHGVIINDLTWLYYKNTKMRCFICGAQPEYEFIKQKFGYPENYVQYTGLARFDSLHTADTDKNLILVMPTWREWLGRESQENKNYDFTESEYFKSWNAFLNSERLAALLEKYDKKLLFYPHRNMQKFLSCFTVGTPRIELADWKNYDVQGLLKRAALLITDYSSVFFDFSYMCKPVIFYQFDEEAFRAKQYAEGYFDYHNTDLGSWSDTSDGVLDLLEENLVNDCPLIDEETIRQFFALRDENNCERIYDLIKSL